MPTFYNFTQGGLTYSFDDVFVPADLFRDGNLWGWGSSGRIGNAILTGTRSTPVTTFAGGSDWKQVSAGESHTAAIKTDGTLWTWGLGDYGALGNASTLNKSTPVTTFAGGTNWKQVSCGNSNVAAIKTDGTLWLWGLAFLGSLGNTETGLGIGISTPITTFAGGTNWKQVSTNDNATAAIKTDGTLWVWGQNSFGELGINAVSSRSTPVTTFAGGNNWKQVSIGGNITAAIKTDGTLWVWGAGGSGTLGNATTQTNTNTPVTTFAGGTDWKQVSCANRLSVAAIKTDGTLWTWGNGSNWVLGNGSSTNRSTPITTFAGGTNWKQVSNSTNSVAAIKTDGTLWTWGDGTAGMLGNASTTDVSTPITTFAGGTNWKQVTSGLSHRLALTYNDQGI